MPSEALPGPPNLEHSHLRAALELAVGVAEAGRKLKPPLVYPAGLKPYFNTNRVPGVALGRIRRVVEANPEFRERLAAAAVPELVDPIGLEWLRRGDGWEARVAALVEEAATAEAEAGAAAEMRRIERRRVAAEQTALRTRAELVVLRDHIAELERDLDEHRRLRERTSVQEAAARDELSAARLAVRHANDRAEAARSKLAATERERDDALQRAEAADKQRDALLAARAEQAGLGVGVTEIVEVRALAGAARVLADRLHALVDITAAPRRAVALPGGVAHSAHASAEFLLRVPRVLVLVDGYNVAKLGWSTLELADQRERILDATDDVARRFGTEIAVVFDGSDVVGSHARRRRLVRVRYSPVGVLADDVIRDEVAALDPSRPVVVVTNDKAVRRDVLTHGANAVSSEAFLDVALR